MRLCLVILPELCLNHFANKHCEDFSAIKEYARQKYNFYDDISSGESNKSLIMCGEIENYFATHHHSKKLFDLTQKWKRVESALPELITKNIKPLSGKSSAITV